jgi:hypothetical protein
MVARNLGCTSIRRTARSEAFAKRAGESVDDMSVVVSEKTRILQQPAISTKGIPAKQLFW